MTGTATRLTAAVETYCGDLGRVRASGGATGERSSYGPLSALLNTVGAALKPSVFCVGELADLGAGHPDFGLYTTGQVQRGRPRKGQVPERGVVEVKSVEDGARSGPYHQTRLFSRRARSHRRRLLRDWRDDIRHIHERWCVLAQRARSSLELSPRRLPGSQEMAFIPRTPHPQSPAQTRGSPAFCQYGTQDCSTDKRNSQIASSPVSCVVVAPLEAESQRRLVMGLQ